MQPKKKAAPKKAAPKKAKQEVKAKQVIVVWDLINQDVELFGLEKSQGKTKQSAQKAARGFFTYKEVVRVTIERF